MLSPAKSRTRGALILLLFEIICIIACAEALIFPLLRKSPPPEPRGSRESDVSIIKTQLSVFEIDNGRYPTTAEGLKLLVENPGNMSTWTHAYLDKMPIDQWGHPYVYRCPGTNGAPFDIYSMGPDGIDGTADDIGDTNRN
jgi:general secretion pathway protein G